MNAYLEPVIALICSQRGIPDDTLDDDSQLLSDCGFDSLDWSELGLSVEEEFDVIVTDEELDRWKTIGDVCRFLQDALGEPVEE